MRKNDDRSHRSSVQRPRLARLLDSSRKIEDVKSPSSTERALTHCTQSAEASRVLARPSSAMSLQRLAVTPPGRTK